MHASEKWLSSCIDFLLSKGFKQYASLIFYSFTKFCFILLAERLLRNDPAILSDEVLQIFLNSNLRESSNGRLPPNIEVNISIILDSVYISLTFLKK